MRISARVDGDASHMSVALFVDAMPVVGAVVLGRVVCYVDALTKDPWGAPMPYVLLTPLGAGDGHDAMYADAKAAAKGTP